MYMEIFTNFTQTYLLFYLSIFIEYLYIITCNEYTVIALD